MEIIGQGTFGRVFVSRDNPSVVVKIIDPKLASFVENREVLLALSNQKSIAKVLDVVLMKTELHIWMIRYKTDLGKFVRDHNRTLNLKSTLRCEAQIGSCLEFLHKRRILHGDVKPDNILVDESLNFFLCDFSISLDLDKNNLNYCKQLYSEPYRPPILFYNTQIKNGNSLREEYDFFALFMTLYFTHQGEKYDEILKSDYDYVQCCIHLKNKQFPKLIQNTFKELTFIDKYNIAFKLSF